MNLTREESIKMIEKMLHSVGEDEAGDLGAVVIYVNKEEGTVRMFGLNLDEEEMVDTMLEAAEVLSDRIEDTMTNRTLN